MISACAFLDHPGLTRFTRAGTMRDASRCQELQGPREELEATESFRHSSTVQAAAMDEQGTYVRKVFLVFKFCEAFLVFYFCKAFGVLIWSFGVLV